MAAKAAPIIVIKKKGGHGGHHGGAWKVAYADFVTAMMALFIVLWLMSQSDPVKKAVAGYFNDPRGTGKLLGTTMTGTGTGTAIAMSDADKQRLEQMKEKLEKEIQSKKELQKLAKQIEITITPEGLRIEFVEGKNGTFYQSGSAQLSETGQELVVLLATELKTLPNDLLIEGHTDATQYSTDANYSNWELSADRANAARRLLQLNGVRSNQVTQVRGYADQFLRVPSDPSDPSNRRITILVRNGSNGAPPALALGHGFATDQPASAAPAASPAAAAAAAKPAAAAPAVAATSQAAASPAKPAAGQPAAAVKPGMMGKLVSLMPGKKK